MRLLPALLLVLPLAACKSEPEEPPPDVDMKLVVASDLDHMPFIGRDADGRPIGRDVEMMESIAAALALPIQWEVVDFGEVLPMVEAGAVDIGCATIGISPERAERVAFTRPYYRTAIAVVVRAGEDEPRTFSQLAGKRVGCATGTTAERAVRLYLPRSECWTDEKEGLSTSDRLLSGELDAAAMDAPDADALVAESDGQLARMPRDLEQERYALAIRTGRPGLLRQIDAILETMEQTGELAMLDEAWGL
jgi:polar amino acid transport system substrate-binding protein